MSRLVKILLLAALLPVVSCRELPDYLVGDDTIARVGRSELSINEISEIMPANLKGEDSVTYVRQYVDRWIVRQLKVEEADRLFSTSEREIERLVEEYRQTLLSSRVDQHYVSAQTTAEVTDEDVAEYYNTHKSDFLLDRTLVKGRILCYDDSYRQSKRLLEQMRKASTSQTEDKTFSDMCEKNGFSIKENILNVNEGGEMVAHKIWEVMPTDANEIEYVNNDEILKNVNENVIIATDQAMVDAGLFKCNPREDEITLWIYNSWGGSREAKSWAPIMRVFTEPLMEDIKDEDGRVIEQKSTHKIDSFYGAPINGDLDLRYMLTKRGVTVEEL